MSLPLRLRPWRHPAIAPLACGVVIVGVATWLRHDLVEPAGLTARCDAAPWQGWQCRLRSFTVQLFIEQRIGWVAIAAGAMALVWRLRMLAWLALAAGAGGLVLYSATLAAPGLLLGALALVRAESAGGAPR